MIFSIRTPGHETVAEIYKTAQGHKGEKDGLFQTDCMCRSGLLFKDAPISYMRAVRHLHTIQKDRSLEKSTTQIYPSAELAVNHSDRGFVTQLCVGTDKRLVSIKFGSTVQDNSSAGYSLYLDVFTDLH